MKTLSTLLLLCVFSINHSFAQCDSLLREGASIGPVCENEWLDIDLATLEYRKGGTWSSSLTNLKSSRLRGYIGSNAYLYYTYTGANSSCTSTDSIYLKVNPLPSIKTTIPSGVCWNEQCFPLTFNATPYGGEWFDTSNVKQFVTGGKFCPSLTPKLDKIARYSLFYTYQDPTTNCADTATTYITVKPLPIVELSADVVKFSIKDDVLSLDDFVVKVNGEGRWNGPGVVEISNKYFFDPAEVQFDTTNVYKLIYNYFSKVGSAPWCDNQDTLEVKLTNGRITTHNETLKSEELSVFPNPTTGNISVLNPLAFNLKVYNLSGQLILDEKYKKGSANIQLPKGIYWLTVRDVKQVKTQKVVVY